MTKNIDIAFPKYYFSDNILKNLNIEILEEKILLFEKKYHSTFMVGGIFRY